MKQKFCLALLLVASMLHAQKGSPLLITEKSWGPITRSTDFNMLVKLYGKAQVKDGETYGPEGMDTLQVTFVFRDRPDEFMIIWEDGLFHKKIASIECYMPGAQFVTQNGIRIGSTLQKLLQVNAKKISFYGVGWDYGGYISSFNNGRLHTSKISYRLDGGGNLPETLYGDVELDTNMPAVRNHILKFKVSSITLRFSEN